MSCFAWLFRPGPDFQPPCKNRAGPTRSPARRGRRTSRARRPRRPRPSPPVVDREGQPVGQGQADPQVADQDDHPGPSGVARAPEGAGQDVHGRQGRQGEGDDPEHGHALERPRRAACRRGTGRTSAAACEVEQGPEDDQDRHPQPPGGPGRPRRRGRAGRRPRYWPVRVPGGDREGRHGQERERLAPDRHAVRGGRGRRPGG